MKKIVAVNTTWQLVGRALGAITTFVVTLIVARQFGASGYGDFIKITTYVAFFYLIADFGINAIFLQHDLRDSWPALVVLRLTGGVALIVLSLLILFLLPSSAGQGYTPVVRLGILLFSPTILLQGMITTANAIFQKKLRYDLATWAIFFGSLITLFLVWNSTAPLVVVGIVASGTFVTAVLSLVFASRLVGNVRFVTTLGQMKQLLVPSIPLGVTLLFNLVYFRADSVVITLTRPTAEVGVYGLAYKVFEVALVFPTFFMNSVYPLMLSRGFKKILTKAFWFLLLVSVLTGILLWITAPLLSYIKSDFAASTEALRVLSLGLPFFFITSVTMWGLIALKKQTVLAGIYGVSMLVNILGNVLLVPTRGYIAAAWMTVVGEGLVLLLSASVLLQALRNNNN